MKKEENKEVKIKKPMTPLKIVLIIVGAYIGFQILMVACIFGFSYLAYAFEEPDFSVDGKTNTAKLTKQNVTVQITDSRYNEESKCYIINSKIDTKGTIKTGFFNTMAKNMDVELVLHDKEGYVVGTTTIFIQDLDNYGKFKPSSEFCEEGAKNVDSVEIKRITLSA